MILGLEGIFCHGVYTYFDMGCRPTRYHLAIGRYGDLEIWRLGDMEIWRFGDWGIGRFIVRLFDIQRGGLHAPLAMMVIMGEPVPSDDWDDRDDWGPPKSIV